MKNINRIQSMKNDRFKPIVIKLRCAIIMKNKNILIKVIYVNG